MLCLRSVDQQAAPLIPQEKSPRWLRGQSRAILVSIACFLRRLPLFVAATPKTPLRVLCLIAFDTLHVVRTSKPLARNRVATLATVLDLGACINAILDRKRFCPREFQAAQRWLKDTEIASAVEEYLRQLRELEEQRPLPGGDRRRFEEVRAYREAVARLSLGTIAAIALADGEVDDGIRAAHHDPDVATLFRIVMLCQIIDDILDYRWDLSAGLPSFLTSASSLQQGLAWTEETVRGYIASRPRRANVFPFQIALFVVSQLTKLILRGSILFMSARRSAVLSGEGNASAAQ